MVFMVIIIIGILVFLIPSIRFLSFLRRLSEETRKQFKKWQFRKFVGHIGLSLSTVFFMILISNIFVKDMNVVLSFSLIPIPVVSILFLLTMYFTTIDKLVTVNDLDKLIDYCSKTLFISARRSIKIVSGTLNSAFFSDDRILESLETAKSRDVDITILFGYPEDKATRANVETNIKNKLAFMKDSLFVLPKIYKNSHFMIVDNLHLRVEKIHPMGEVGRTNSIYFFSHISAWSLNRRFERLLSTARKIELDND